jgi:hypothetical protein
MLIAALRSAGHTLEEILDEYLQVSKLREKPAKPLFPMTLGKSRIAAARRCCWRKWKGFDTIP